MFKRQNSADDIFSSMEQNLVKNAEQKSMKSKVARAIDLIADSAERLERAGAFDQAEKLTKLLEAFAGSIDYVATAGHDANERDTMSSDDSEQLVKNELETGTLFPRKDFGKADDLEIDEKGLKNMEASLDFEDEK